MYICSFSSFIFFFFELIVCENVFIRNRCTLDYCFFLFSLSFGVECVLIDIFYDNLCVYVCGCVCVCVCVTSSSVGRRFRFIYEIFLGSILNNFRFVKSSCNNVFQTSNLWFKSIETVIMVAIHRQYRVSFYSCFLLLVIYVSKNSSIDGVNNTSTTSLTKTYWRNSYCLWTWNKRPELKWDRLHFPRGQWYLSNYPTNQI